MVVAVVALKNRQSDPGPDARGYDEDVAWRWIREWARLYVLARGRTEAGEPPASAKLHWDMEHRLCVLGDLEDAAKHVPDDFLVFTLLRYRYDLSARQISTYLRGRVAPGECWDRARLGAQCMVRWLVEGR